MPQTEQDKAFNADLRRAARQGKILAVKQTHRDGATGRFVAGSDMNRSIREEAGRISLTKLEQTTEM